VIGNPRGEPQGVDANIQVCGNPRGRTNMAMAMRQNTIMSSKSSRGDTEGIAKDTVPFRKTTKPRPNMARNEKKEKNRTFHFSLIPTI
jgi:hypothetical protein